MPAPKKAATKAAKHEPEGEKPKVKDKHKKHEEKGPKHKTLKDVRRSYEHLGRVETLMPHLSTAAKTEVMVLIALAQSVLSEGHARDAADLLRASEHLAFAATTRAEGKNEKLAPVVKQAVEEEFEHFSRKAVEHWKETDDRHQEVRNIYKRVSESAKQALAKGAYRRAMELVRAAEALAHIEKRGPEKLPAGKQQLSLTT